MEISFSFIAVLKLVLNASNDDEVGYIIETNQLSIELEELLFEKMDLHIRSDRTDHCPIEKIYQFFLLTFIRGLAARVRSNAK